MGRPKVKFIDDSAPESEEKKQKVSKKSVESSEATKLESVEASSEVERTSEANESSQDEGAEQTSSKRTGDASNASRPSESTSTAKPKKPGKAKPRSKKYQEVSKDLDKNQSYALNEAIELVKKGSITKFTGSLEAHINTIQTGIRGLVSLPFASGKKLKILAFGEDAANSGADIIGTEEVIEEINKGKVNFDLVVTTPSWMPKLAKVARILGPRGIMPNPKNGTITSDLKKAVEGFQAGKTEYKTEPKSPLLHMNLGKLDQPTEELAANVKALMTTLGKTRVKKMKLAPTMGPSVRINLTSI